jgi:protein tyrosine/serine phosphatase
METALERIYQQLRDAGPVRFAQVDAHLYRGGQPSVEQVRWLHELGVRTIVCLRSGDVTVGEEATARALGMSFIKLPFRASFNVPKGDRLRQIVAAIQHSPDPVYVHCAQGRDRTSLIVALYRVWVQKWAPALAWQREAVAFGHSAPWFAGLDVAFDSLTGVASASPL